MENRWPLLTLAGVMGVLAVYFVVDGNTLQAIVSALQAGIALFLFRWHTAHAESDEV